MRTSKTLALMALGAGLALAPQANAFEYGMGPMAGAQEKSDHALGLRFSAPFGGTSETRESGPKLALEFSRSGEVSKSSVDVATYSFSGAHKGLTSPLTLGANGDDNDKDGWFSSTGHKVLFGVGAALLLWGIVEATEDDDDPAPPTTL